MHWNTTRHTDQVPSHNPVSYAKTLTGRATSTRDPRMAVDDPYLAFELLGTAAFAVSGGAV